MDFVTVSTGLILPYWMGLPIRYIQVRKVAKETCFQESCHCNDERFKKSKGICKNRFLKPGKIPVEEWNTSCFSCRENGLQ